jgi:hypothetical protein
MMPNKALHRTGAMRCDFRGFWFYYITGFGGRPLSAPVGDLGR